MFRSRYRYIQITMEQTSPILPREETLRQGRMLRDQSTPKPT